MMIKCEDFACGYYNKRKKQGCSRQADPHTCKGYLNTIISIQQNRISNIEDIVEKALNTDGAETIHRILQDIYK